MSAVSLQVDSVREGGWWQVLCHRLGRRVNNLTMPFLRNFHQLTVFEQAEMILYAALDPSIASKAKKGEFVKCLDHFDLLQSARN